MYDNITNREAKQSDPIIEILEAETAEQEAFDNQEEIFTAKRYDESEAEQAWKKDTNNLHDPAPRYPLSSALQRIDGLHKDWNDEDQAQVNNKCIEITKALRHLPVFTSERSIARDKLHEVDYLLDISFSEKIKQHIVELTTTIETVVGACNHCFDRYKEESKLVKGNSMMIWFDLASLIGTVHVYKAFLERAWHLTPSSCYFPERYKELQITLAKQHEAQLRHDTVHYAFPQNQLEALNDTLKQLKQAERSTTGPKELSSLSRSIVRVIGAIHIINREMQKEHARELEDVKLRMLSE